MHPHWSLHRLDKAGQCCVFPGLPSAFPMLSMRCGKRKWLHGVETFQRVSPNSSIPKPLMLCCTNLHRVLELVKCIADQLNKPGVQLNIHGVVTLLDLEQTVMHFLSTVIPESFAYRFCYSPCCSTFHEWACLMNHPRRDLKCCICDYLHLLFKMQVLMQHWVFLHQGEGLGWVWVQQLFHRSTVNTLVIL